MPAKPVRIAWELEAAAPIARTWALFSDTDRYNRAVGFGFTFEDTPQEDGSVERTGTASIMGVRFVWDELPFEYRANEWYRIRRRFRSGPATDLTITLRLAARGGATGIRYTIEAIPRNALTRPIVKLELNGKTKPKIDRVLNIMLRRLANPATTYDPTPPGLSREAEALLTKRVESMTHKGVGQRLADFIRSGPLHVQNQLHPLKLAQLWKLEADETVSGLLEATRLGVIDLQWDLLCPMCRGTKLQTKTLPLNPPEAHCSSCNIRYDGGFPDSIAISFRTSAQLRKFEVAPACIGSPALQPQVMAQDNIEPEETTSFAVHLEVGTYRIRTVPSRRTTSILVEPKGQTSECRFTLSHNALQPERVVLKPGLCLLALENASFHRITACLEKRHLPDETMTAGQLLMRYAHTEALPDWLFEPTQTLDTKRCWVVAVEVAQWAPAVLDALRRWSEASPTKRLKRDGSAVVVSFDDAEVAMSALANILGHADMSVAIGHGEVVEASSEAFTTQFGDVVDAALVAASACLPGRAYLLKDSEAQLRDPLSAHGWAVAATTTSLGRDTLVVEAHRLSATDA